MDNRIEAIRQQQIYRVNPVSLYERREPQNNLEKTNFFSDNNSPFNLSHPDSKGYSGNSGILDLLA